MRLPRDGDSFVVHPSLAFVAVQDRVNCDQLILRCEVVDIDVGRYDFIVVCSTKSGSRSSSEEKVRKEGVMN